MSKKKWFGLAALGASVAGAVGAVLKLRKPGEEAETDESAEARAADGPSTSSDDGEETPAESAGEEERDS